MRVISRPGRWLQHSLGLALSAALLWPTLSRAGLPSGFSLENLGVGFLVPTTFAFTPGGGLLVLEKDGRLIHERAGNRQLVLDLSEETNSNGDLGALGLALDPNFATTGFLYLYFTAEAEPVAAPDQSEIAEGVLIRITTDPREPQKIDHGSRRTLVRGFFTRGALHAGGGLRFDHEGRLLLALGDGTRADVADAGALQALDTDSLSGKLLRIDSRTGEGVAENPNFDPAAPAEARSRILARGFRNPFRLGIDGETGEPIVADVGWKAFEELNRVPLLWTAPEAELNFGWPCTEGAMGVPEPQAEYRTAPQTMGICGPAAPSVAPVFAYAHGEPGGEAGSAIVAGASLPGVNYPPEFRDAFWFGDYGRDRLQLLHDGGRITTFGSPGGFGAPVDFQVSPRGNLAYLAISDGTVREIVYSGEANHPPVPVGFALPAAGAAPLRVRFHGEWSYDLEGDRFDLSWRIGGRILRGRQVGHVFKKAGIHEVFLTARERRSGMTSKVVRLEVQAGNRQPKIEFLEPTDRTIARVGSMVPVSLDARDPEDGQLPDAALHWQAILHHGGHLHYLPSHVGRQGSFVLPAHQDANLLEIRATAVDSGGVKSSISRRLQIAP